MINTRRHGRKDDFGRPTAGLRREALGSWIEGGPIPGGIASSRSAVTEGEDVLQSWTKTDL